MIVLHLSGECLRLSKSRPTYVSREAERVTMPDAGKGYFILDSTFSMVYGGEIPEAPRTVVGADAKG